MAVGVELLSARHLERLCLAAALMIAIVPPQPTWRPLAGLGLLLAFVIRMESPPPGQGIGQYAPPLPATLQPIAPHSSILDKAHFESRDATGRRREAATHDLHPDQIYVLIFTGAQLDSGVRKTLPRIQKMWAMCRGDKRVHFLIISRASKELLTSFMSRADENMVPIACDEEGGEHSLLVVHYFHVLVAGLILRIPQPWFRRGKRSVHESISRTPHAETGTACFRGKQLAYSSKSLIVGPIHASVRNRVAMLVGCLSACHDMDVHGGKILWHGHVNRKELNSTLSAAIKQMEKVNSTSTRCSSTTANVQLARGCVRRQTISGPKLE
eukprot:scaffold206319_cov39-Tisochrysis_lutea.AAC.1